MQEVKSAKKSSKSKGEGQYKFLNRYNKLLIIKAMMGDIQRTQFICPMKCEGEKFYDQPGNCPICRMQLIPVDGILRD